MPQYRRGSLERMIYRDLQREAGITPKNAARRKWEATEEKPAVVLQETPDMWMRRTLVIINQNAHDPDVVRVLTVALLDYLENKK